MRASEGALRAVGHRQIMAGTTSGKAIMMARDRDIEGPGSIRLGLTAVITTLIIVWHQTSTHPAYEPGHCSDLT